MNQNNWTVCISNLVKNQYNISLINSVFLKFAAKEFSLQRLWIEKEDKRSKKKSFGDYI